MNFYSDEAATIAAVLGGQVDLVGQIQFTTGRPLFNNSSVHVFAVRGATHRQVPMRVDLKNPLRDYRVRQAIALTLDRAAIIKTLFNNFADIGNDSPFARVYPSTDKSVPQPRLLREPLDGGATLYRIVGGNVVYQHYGRPPYWTGRRAA